MKDHPAPVSPLHKCRHPVRHTLEALGAAIVWGCISWAICLRLGSWLSALARLDMITGPTWLVGWCGIIIVYCLWITYGMLGGTWMIYVIVMAGCNRALERAARQQRETARSRTSPHKAGHCIIERVHLSAQDTARYGFQGPVTLERVYEEEG